MADIYISVTVLTLGQTQSFYLEVVSQGVAIFETQEFSNSSKKQGSL